MQKKALVIIFFGIFLISCGLKTPVVMPKVTLPEITEFSGQIIEGKIKLTWKYTNGKAEGFKIFKSACEGCPLLEVCEIKIKKHKNIISWIDTDVHPGYNYWYQVMSFYKEKVGPKSKIIEIKFKTE